MTTYTSEFKAAMIKKILANPDLSVKSISIEAGIPSSTLNTWKNKYYQKKGMTLSKKKKNKLKSVDKFNHVMLTATMNEAEKSEYCRKKGLYTEEIEQWIQDCIAGCKDKASHVNAKQHKENERKWKQEAKRLEKELNRKEKALAETAALLVLKKKIQKIWGDPEEEE